VVRSHERREIIWLLASVQTNIYTAWFKEKLKLVSCYNDVCMLVVLV
jgi:hypothetical protein